MEKYDAVIVGARCAGSATARLLATSGMRVLLVDRAMFPSDTVSTHAIALHGCELLRQWGLFERLVAAGTPTYDAMTVGVGDVRLDRVPSAASCMAPRRTVLDKLLVDAAGEAGVELWDGTVVEGLTWRGDRVTGLVAGGAEVSADLVIGADGAHSAVARWVDASRSDVEPSDLIASYAYFAGTDIDHPYVFLSDRRLLLLIPTNDDLVCAVIGGASADDRIIGVSDEAFWAVAGTLCADLGDALADAERVTPFRAFRPQPAYFARAFGPGWALVGDAGLYIDPITGQGIANAFASAQFLSDAVLSRDLASYAARRDEFFAPIADVTAELARMDWGNDEAVGLFLRFRDAVATSYESVCSRSERTSPVVQPAR